MKNYINISDLVKKQLSDWAREKNIDINGRGYIAGSSKKAINANLFGGLDKKSEEEYGAGKGSELKGKRAQSPKMAALHSSSALACNVFQYWRRIEYYDIITQALGFGTGYDNLKLESVHKIDRKPGTPPHLDVEIFGVEDILPLAIESKYLESYEEKDKKKIPFKEAYFTVKDMWDGYEKCRKLAQEINDEHDLFRYFDAPQILKHMLGLYHSYGKHKFVLMYLWYKIDSQEAENHEQEIDFFKGRIASEFDFRVMTYQELFEKIRNLCGKLHSDYISYLKNRYFKPISI